MRSILYTILLIAVILSGSLSCIKKVSIPLPPHDKRLVLHGYCPVGKLIEVNVGHTERANRYGTDTYITNATVLLFQDGIFADTLQYDPASLSYISKKIVAAVNVRYQVKASADGYPGIEAIASARAVPLLQDLKRKRDARQTSYGTWYDELTFTFQDPTGESNYYLTELHGGENGTRYMSCVLSADPALEPPRGSLLPIDEKDCMDATKIFFSDQSFNGQVKTLSLYVWSPSLDWFQAPNGKMWRPYLKRYIISKEYYDYYRANSNPTHDDDLPLITEPETPKGNVINGYGLFTVFEVRTDTIR